MNKRTLYVVAGLAVAGALAGGGGALATTGSDDRPVAGPNAAQARTAAVDYLGSGRAGSAELDGEHGATYDVEVHSSNGSVTDVWLDAGFAPINSELDSEG